MLKEFYEKVRADLAEKSQIELRKLVSTDGAERHDLIRGQYTGIAGAITTLDDTFREFADNETADIVDAKDVAGQRANAERLGRRFSRGG